MAGEKERVDSYLETLGRMEPDVAPTDPSAYGTSIAISLKRIADATEALVATAFVGIGVAIGTVGFLHFSNGGSS